eukprot:COSAG02_NODE_10075_length_2032_cov_1.948784_3_plen_157_part_01
MQSRWSEWRTAALKRIELLQEVLDAHERSPPKQSAGGEDAQVHWAEYSASKSNIDMTPPWAPINRSESKTRRPVAADQDWPWDGEDNSKKDDDANDSEGIGVEAEERWMLGGSCKGTDDVARSDSFERHQFTQLHHLDSQHVDEEIDIDEREEEEEE